MAKRIVKTVLVIGDNHEEIIRKYSADTKVKTYVKFKRQDAEAKQKYLLKLTEQYLQNIPLNDIQYDMMVERYRELKEMTDFEFYLEYTKGCHYDEETGDALSEENPNAFYRNEKCYHDRFVKSGYIDEAPFSNPFKLKDNKLGYIAHFNDIDWSKNHMYNTEIYKAAWELVVEDREPVNETEEQIKNNMSNRKEYFNNFKDCDEYVRHSCSFWTYGVANEKEYIELDYSISDIDWKTNFYERFIKPIKGNPILSIYEVRVLND